jgi:hypothetical protein
MDNCGMPGVEGYYKGKELTDYFPEYLPDGRQVYDITYKIP